MLEVTTRARNELHGLLLQALEKQPEASRAGIAIRLVAGSNEDTRSGLSPALDSVRSGDEIVEHDGRTILVVDASASELLGPLTLDVVETPEGRQLELRG